MSGLIPGKRYRWTVEGVATDEGWLEIGSARDVSPGALHRGKLEQLPDPLPTTPGSVVQCGGRTMMRRAVYADGNEWVGQTGVFFGAAELKGATVLFDAGADQ